MADINPFIKIFNSIDLGKHRYQVFADFITMSAIAIQNVFLKSNELEAEYMNIVGQYSKKDVHKLAELLQVLTSLLEPDPMDVLGTIYMELDFGNAKTGQFFTPPALSLMLAQITYGDGAIFKQKPFVTMSEPTSGAGGMVLAFVKIMHEHNINPAEKLWVQCIDVDRIAALMCYIQLSLWGIPAQVIVGNTLSMDFKEIYYTPIHYIHRWNEKLANKDEPIKALLNVDRTKNGEAEKTETKTQPFPFPIGQKEKVEKKEKKEKGQSDLFDV